jgi:ribonuclease P protein component
VVAVLSSTHVAPKVASVSLSNSLCPEQTRELYAVDRLKQWSEFQAVMAASTVAKTSHFVLHQWQHAEKASTGPGFEKTPALFAEGVLILGALTPKRCAKRAVTRNLIKRQIYSVSASFGARLKPTAYVVRLRTEFDRKYFVSASSLALKQAVKTELTQLFAKIATP